MIEVVAALAVAFLEVLGALAPFLLLGFAVAGLLHAFVPGRWLYRALGGSGGGPILRAALIGVPLPLCSCGVVPIAAELRRRGASRGATASFLVSTPETGVDSISTSVAVLHPLMVVFRPLAAFVTAIATGFAVERFTHEPAVPATGGDCCHHAPAADIDAQPKGFIGGMRYAFVDLFGEVGMYLVPSILVTALLTVLIEPAAIASLVPSRPVQMLLLLIAGIPVYVCATAATPMGAALIMAGFSPGAALVFLLAGPATNVMTIAAAARSLGRGGAAVYVLTIAVVSLGMGAVLDLSFDALGVTPTAAASALHEHTGWLGWASAAIIGALVVWHFVRRLRQTS